MRRFLSAALACGALALVAGESRGQMLLPFPGRGGGVTIGNYPAGQPGTYRAARYAAPAASYYYPSGYTTTYAVPTYATPAPTYIYPAPTYVYPAPTTYTYDRAYSGFANSPYPGARVWGFRRR